LNANLIFKGFGVRAKAGWIAGARRRSEKQKLKG
jgi:hypothetical protein